MSDFELTRRELIQFSGYGLLLMAIAPQTSSARISLAFSPEDQGQSHHYRDKFKKQSPAVRAAQLRITKTDFEKAQNALDPMLKKTYTTFNWVLNQETQHLTKMYADLKESRDTIVLYIFGKIINQDLMLYDSKFGSLEVFKAIYSSYSFNDHLNAVTGKLLADNYLYANVLEVGASFASQNDPGLKLEKSAKNVFEKTRYERDLNNARQSMAKQMENSRDVDRNQYRNMERDLASRTA